MQRQRKLCSEVASLVVFEVKKHPGTLVGLALVASVVTWMAGVSYVDRYADGIADFARKQRNDGRPRKDDVRWRARRDAYAKALDAGGIPDVEALRTASQLLTSATNADIAARDRQRLAKLLASPADACAGVDQLNDAIRLPAIDWGLSIDKQSYEYKWPRLRGITLACCLLAEAERAFGARESGAGVDQIATVSQFGADLVRAGAEMAVEGQFALRAAFATVARSVALGVVSDVEREHVNAVLQDARLKDTWPAQTLEYEALQLARLQIGVSTLSEAAASSGYLESARRPQRVARVPLIASGRTVIAGLLALGRSSQDERAGLAEQVRQNAQSSWNPIVASRVQTVLGLVEGHRAITEAKMLADVAISLDRYFSRMHRFPATLSESYVETVSPWSYRVTVDGYELSDGSSGLLLRGRHGAR